jgi:alpha-galactosidase
VTIRVARLDPAPALSADLDGAAWRPAAAVPIATTWRGDAVPAELATVARLGWCASYLWIAYDCAYRELDADAGPDVDVTRERGALWERDVCEAFVASAAEPHAESYKEFEVAPTGQWCDLAIHRPRVDVDMGWHSGMATAAAVDAAAGRWRAVMRVPFSAFGGPPARGDAWRANLVRIGRIDGERHYLALSPTGTAAPDFHVPAAFVPLVFE